MWLNQVRSHKEQLQPEDMKFDEQALGAIMYGGPSHKNKDSWINDIAVFVTAEAAVLAKMEAVAATRIQAASRGKWGRKRAAAARQKELEDARAEED